MCAFVRHLLSPLLLPPLLPLFAVLLCAMAALPRSEMRGRKGGTTDAVRQIAARRRLERAQVGLLRASAALEEFDREQRGSAPSSPAADDADAGAADEQVVVSGGCVAAGLLRQVHVYGVPAPFHWSLHCTNSRSITGRVPQWHEQVFGRVCTLLTAAYLLLLLPCLSGCLSLPARLSSAAHHCPAAGG